MANKKEETAVYEEEFSARVNKEGDVNETILRSTRGPETLVVYGKGAKFKDDSRYRISITEIPEPEPESEGVVNDKSATDKKQAT